MCSSPPLLAGISDGVRRLAAFTSADGMLMVINADDNDDICRCPSHTRCVERWGSVVAIRVAVILTVAFTVYLSLSVGCEPWQVASPWTVSADVAERQSLALEVITGGDKGVGCSSQLSTYVDGKPSSSSLH